MKSAELCAGYGGLALAIEEVFEARTVWFSEFDKGPSRILAHRWPGVPNYGDMTQIDWAAVEGVDVLGGGTPCQDLSALGARAGMTEGTRSNLWAQMREAIATIQPRYVVWENVRGAYSAAASSDMEFCPGCVGGSADRGTVLRALGRVLGDLSDLGYDTQWRGLRAADVGACHNRFRVFVLATHRNGGRAGRGSTVSGNGQKQGADSALVRAGNRAGEPGTASGALAVAYPGNNGSQDQRFTGAVVPEIPAAGGDSGAVAWGEYEEAVRSWETVLGRRAPAPTEPTGRDGAQRLSARFTEWMMGLPDGWITDVPGITRKEAIKACGNGVVPQQAAAALRDMLAMSEALA